jgi:hypothetical protein
MSNLGQPIASALVFATSLNPGETDRIMQQDMVDTTPFNVAEPSLRADAIVKIVLGALNSTLDHGKVSSSVPQY